jgi:membrane protein DedA with SNARE-associated domain
MTLFGITVAGVLGNLFGSWIAYWVGLYGGRPFIDKYGRYVLLRHHHVELAERWFAKYGPLAVFFSRMLPIVRTFISLPAGIAKMPFWKFTLYTVLGCIPWVFFLGWLGTRLGAHWEDIRPYLHYADYAVVAALAAIVVYAVVRWRRGRRASAAPDAEGEA